MTSNAAARRAASSFYWLLEPDNSTDGISGGLIGCLRLNSENRLRRSHSIPAT